MESANREDAKKCIDKAKSALKAGHFSYSLKLAQKSVRLCPSDEAKGNLGIEARLGLVIMLCYSRVFGSCEEYQPGQRK